MTTVKLRVEKGSPAWKAGLRPGMLLETVNGEPILDFIDLEYFRAQTKLVCRVAGDSREFVIRMKDDEDPGFEPEEEMYPAEKRCANLCVFCFEDQLPKNVRPSLRSKDDDWRYSLLFGNYVTMTNMRDEDFDRLIARKVSPINISVHATDPEVRVRLMANPKAAQIMDQLKRLKDGGIEFHAQVVLCPGYNDGAVLSRTLHDLWGLYPAARSVAVVPLGMTCHREGLAKLAPVTAAIAESAIRETEAFSAWTRKEHGVDFAFASDEMYQIARRPWPRYEGGSHQPQIANGVGLFHDLLTDFEAALEDAPAALETPRTVTLATGASAAATMKELMDRLAAHTGGFAARVVEVPNRFFGESVTVAGLLTGGDLAAALEGKSLGDAVLIPGNTLRDGEAVFLDDMTWDELQARLGAPVIPVPDDGWELLRLALGLEEESWL